RKTLALLALLATAGHRGLSRDKLIATLWPDTDAEHGSGLLRQACYALRRDLHARELFLGSIQLTLNPDIISSDVEEFTSALDRNDPAGAVSCYTAPFLDGFYLDGDGEFETWAETERASLAKQCLRALEELSAEATKKGEHQSAVDCWRRFLELEPLSSRGALGLMTALDNAGERAEALRWGQAHGALLRSELGADPSPEVSAWIEVHRQLRSIAVLPFVFLNDAGDSKALSLGFADALITLFGNLKDVVVAPTSAILQYAPGTDPAQVCRDLDVRHTLQGTVQRIGTHWRVSVQLYDAMTHQTTLSEKHDFNLDDVFEVQDEIGRRVVGSLQSRFTLAPPKSRDRYSNDPEAYNEFIAGLRESFPDRQDLLRSAAQHLSRAVERDPEFALAHASLSQVSMDMHFHFDPQRTWLQLAEDHCRRALALDPLLPEGHLARAWILWSPAKNFQHVEAIAALEQVLAARPNFERAHNRMASICLHIGRLPEARIAHERAQLVNPKTRTGNLEYFYIYSGDLAQAEAAAESWFADRPANTYALVTRIVPPLLSGDLELAEQRIAAALERLPDEPWVVSYQGMLHARRDQADQALQCVRRALDSPHSFGHTHHTYYNIACIHALLRDTGTAMAWLDRSVNTGFACWPFFRWDPYLENLRNEPAFTRLVGDLERTYAALEVHRL
ncbi:MAG TPA: BTAD domain-containing putative transcriptional regulator, partial [Gemmatimonadales bacterium]|nr:BTAD domain-containing putative transcriptional regulator [Gemmatimonadales bacterium]